MINGCQYCCCMCRTTAFRWWRQLPREPDEFVQPLNRAATVPAAQEALYV